MTSSIKFTAIPTQHAQKWWDGGQDDYSNPLEHRVSDGSAPCRHCLENIAEGKPVLLGAYKPFQGSGAFTETGPIFICGEPCQRYQNEKGTLPPVIAQREQLMIRGYSPDEKIDYTTGQIVQVAELEDVAKTIFNKEDVAFIHLRSAGYTCFTTRIDRAD
ncbi:DUF1203 domain-containing protein [Maritalea sp.]|uniref:DUF1203 domain-containing protein n=1 Tax=Maritalea sp. TaxID=2003361 RepID=UPI003EF13A9E